MVKLTRRMLHTCCGKSKYVAHGQKTSNFTLASAFASSTTEVSARGTLRVLGKAGMRRRCCRPRSDEVSILIEEGGGGPSYKPGSRSKDLVDSAEDPVACVTRESSV